MVMRRSGQVWSIEMIVAASVFIVVFVFVLVLVTFSEGDSYRELQAETVTLATTVATDEQYGFVEGGSVDKEKFAELAQMNYSKLKRELGMGSDFCIFIEDSKGNLVPVIWNGENITAIGNGSGILVGGKPCGQ